MTSSPDQTVWLTIPDLVERLGLSVGRVHRLLENDHLVALRVDGALRVPEVFLKDGEALPELRGTLIVLGDAGYSAEEKVEWLLHDTESFGVAPIEALRSGRKAEVRRVAQSLGF